MTQHDIVISEGFTEEFFAPAATDLLDGLIAQYRSVRKTIAHTAGLFAGDMGNIVHYFMHGNGCDQRGYSSLSAERLFQEKGAVAALNAAYWSKALALTDVLDMMPQKRRDEWNEQITKMTTPEFTEDAVRPTLADLRNRENPMEPDRARAVAQVASVLVDTAKVEIDYLKITGHDNSGFIDGAYSPAPDYLPAPAGPEKKSIDRRDAGVTKNTRADE